MHPRSFCRARRSVSALCRPAACTSAAFSTAAAAASPASASPTYDLIVVGGGIVGVACARAIALRHPHRRCALLEAQPALATAQSAHNSGVIHAGIYYKPGSARALLCREGAESMLAYCEARKLPARRVGKIIVATTEAERPALEELMRRGQANQCRDLEMLTGAQVSSLEPNVRATAGILSPHTAVANFPAVARSFAAEFRAAGGAIHTDFEVVGVEQDKVGGAVDSITLSSRSGGSIRARSVIFAGGIYSDRLAALCGGAAEPRIVPVRGSWLQLKPEHAHIVQRNIYPVPNAAFPFLGVHFTPTIDDDSAVNSMLLGPNAVLATSREGYALSNFNLRDSIDLLRDGSLRAMAAKHWRFGLDQLAGEVFPERALRDCQRYVPSLRWEHLLVRRGWSMMERPVLRSGVRAQAMAANGALEEDFIIQEQHEVGDGGLAAGGAASKRASILHIRNAPSPAATSSLEIAELVASRAEKAFHW